MKKLKIGSALIFLAFFLGCSKSEVSPPVMSPLSGKAGSMSRFGINGDYLYTLDNSSIKVFSISTASSPVYLNQVTDLVSLETIFIRDHQTLFVGATSGMYVFSIENPVKPKQLAMYSHITSCDPVVADSVNAYVTLRSGGNCNTGVNELHILSLTDITSPVLTNSYEMSCPKGLAVDGQNLIICDDSLRIYNRLTSPNLVPLKSFPLCVNDIIATEGHYILTGNEGIYQYKYAENELTLLSKLTILP